MATSKKRSRGAPPEYLQYTTLSDIPTACCGTCPNWVPPLDEDEAYGVCRVTAAVLPFEVFEDRNVAVGYPKGEPSLVKRVRGNLKGLPVATTHKIRERRIVPIEEVRRGDDWQHLRTGGWGVCDRYAGDRPMASRWDRGTFMLVVPSVCDGPEGDDPGEEAFVVTRAQGLAHQASLPGIGYRVPRKAF